MSTYDQVHDGVPFTETYRRRNKQNVVIYDLSCCHCGLVHNVMIEPLKTRARISMWRDNRKTAQRRRWMREKGEVKA